MSVLNSGMASFIRIKWPNVIQIIFVDVFLFDVHIKVWSTPQRPALPHPARLPPNDQHFLITARLSPNDQHLLILPDFLQTTRTSCYLPHFLQTTSTCWYLPDFLQTTSTSWYLPDFLQTTSTCSSCQTSSKRPALPDICHTSSKRPVLPHPATLPPNDQHFLISARLPSNEQHFLILPHFLETTSTSWYLPDFLQRPALPHHCETSSITQKNWKLRRYANRMNCGQRCCQLLGQCFDLGNVPIYEVSTLHACVDDPCFWCFLGFSFLRKQKTGFGLFQRYYAVHRPISEVDNIQDFAGCLCLPPGISNKIIRVVTPNTWK